MEETNLQPAGNTLPLSLRPQAQGHPLGYAEQSCFGKPEYSFCFLGLWRLRFLKLVPQFPYFRDQKEKFLQEVARAMLVSRSITVQPGEERYTSQGEGVQALSPS